MAQLLLPKMSGGALIFGGHDVEAGRGLAAIAALWATLMCGGGGGSWATGLEAVYGHKIRDDPTHF